MDLVFVDKLTSQNNGVKCLLVAVDFFLSFVRVQTRKTKYSKDTLQVFKKMISQRKFWVVKRIEYGGFFKKFCKEKDIELYAKMSQAKAVFLERSN